MFICDLGIEDQCPAMIVKRFSCELDFNVVEPLSIDKSPDFCDELTGPF